MWIKITEILGKFSALSFSVKFLIISLAGTLGGSTYIAFLSEYATYYYAWDAGIRIPAEGSPYLKATIAAISFIAILASIFVFFVIYISGKVVVLIFFNIEGKEIRGILSISLSKMSWKRVLIASFSTGVIGAFLWGFTLYFKYGSDRDIIQESLQFGSFLFVSYIIMCKRVVTVMLSSSIALLFLALSPFILFNVELYGNLLKELGYGGKLPITVIYPSEKDKSRVSLFLRTSSSLFIFNKEGNIVEYPISEIKYIEYHK